MESLPSLDQRDVLLTPEELQAAKSGEGTRVAS
jgi:hypothetical protein